MISYKIQPINPNAHFFEICLNIENPDSKGQVCYLPNWIPGSYMIRDFVKHIQWIKAESNGKEVAYKQLDKSSWQFAPCEGELKITYQVYAWDLSVRGAHLDQTHGFFNGTSVFLAVKGREQDKHQVETIRPVCDEFSKWKVATGLKPAKATNEFDFGFYEATNYDELIDCPIEMADFTLISFKACGIPHHMTLTGRFEKLDTERLKKDLTKICEHHLEFFGKPYPMQRYIFMTYVLGNGFGGLEHRNSTALHCSREDLPLTTDDPNKVKKNYQTFLDLCSHEYFHTWNVKQIKPSVFLPYDTQQESYTELLWAFEGITSYYDSLACVQAGTISTENYLTALAKTISSVRRSKGRLVQSITDSSFNAWTKYYKQDENAPNSVISYYTKGALIALCLDFLIKDTTSNNKSLKDVMRTLWREYGSIAKGVENDTIQNIVIDLCGQKYQDKVNQFFKRALYTTEDLPLEKVLDAVGLELKYAPRKSLSDRGGWVKEFTEKTAKISLGIEYKSAAIGIKVKNVYLDSAASKAGISAGDNLISLNGIKLDYSTFEKRLAERTIGETVELLAFRRDELHSFKLKLEASEADTAYISYKNKEPSEQLKNWLKIQE